MVPGGPYTLVVGCLNQALTHYVSSLLGETNNVAGGQLYPSKVYSLKDCLDWLATGYDPAAAVMWTMVIYDESL